MSHFLYFAAGAAGAGLYLTVLWWSVRLFVRRQSALLLVGGLVMRLGLLFALGAAAYATKAMPSEFIAGAGGFLAARLLALGRSPDAGGRQGGKERSA